MALLLRQSRSSSSFSRSRRLRLCDKRTNDFIYECDKNNIFLLYLQLHTSHVLQALDLLIFGPVKTTYQTEISRIGHLTDSTPIRKATFLGVYHKARIGTLTIKNIATG